MQWVELRCVFHKPFIFGSDVIANFGKRWGELYARVFQTDYDKERYVRLTFIQTVMNASVCFLKTVTRQKDKTPSQPYRI